MSDLTREDGKALSRAIRGVVVATVVNIVIYALVAWPDRRAAATVVALGVVRIAVNATAARVFRNMHKAREVLGFAIWNAAISLATAHVLHWHLVSLLELSIQAVTIDRFGKAARSRAILAGILVVNLIVATLDGVPLATIGVAALTAAFVSFIVDEFTAMSRVLLVSLDRGHAELVSAHERLEALHSKLLAQDRLTSLGMIAASIAHEINNPMSFVTANTEMMRDDLAALSVLPPVLREHADDILPATLDGIARVNRIVADLRRFARSEADHPTPVDVNREVVVAVRIAAGHLRGKGRLSLDLAPDLASIQGYPQQIGQVVLNLLVNAAHATDERGTIRVATRNENGNAVLEVADDGVGMDDETRRRMFEPFFTTKAPGSGTGLGLAAVHEIVTRHGGTVDVRSARGAGTTLTVRLP